MTKKISCRVIKSVHFGVTGTALQPIERMNDCLYESDELNTAKFWFEQVKGTIKNIKGFELEKGILNSMPSGQILDYLA
ncbi:MAG: hypothetical protein A2Y10_16245 [Planctomycetes bacterium GWF2_41_51]|nr:MAG: hypothetical protein A2Y10_16245 [Planctomycetes bacterium GWF2_41_51]HBG26577.1 hypothetical protein [Phycisphaerales bacterium]